MKLSNTTPLAARVLLGEAPGSDLRFGCLVAKATYRFDAAGGLVLDLEHPLPVIEEDQQTPVGIIPRDDLIFCTRHMEVITLGSAVAPRAARRMTVSLSVGDEERELLVTGDRTWLGEQGGGGISGAAPFSLMPLTWQRAFGGREEVRITRDTAVDAAHPLNPEGRGFDPAPMLCGLEEALYVEPGYPRWNQERPLPNVESPDEGVMEWSDDPVPTCWAPAPMDSPMFLARLGGVADTQAEEVLPPASEDLIQRAMDPEVLHRAHPAWVIPLPPPGAQVRMAGLTPWARAAFNLPLLGLTCDWLLGQRSGQRELIPARLILLPDEARFCLVFVHRFTYKPTPGEERALRLRMEINR